MASQERLEIHPLREQGDKRMEQQVMVALAVLAVSAESGEKYCPLTSQYLEKVQFHISVVLVAKEENLMAKTD